MSYSIERGRGPLVGATYEAMYGRDYTDTREVSVILESGRLATGYTSMKVDVRHTEVAGINIRRTYIGANRPPGDLFEYRKAWLILHAFFGSYRAVALTNGIIAMRGVVGVMTDEIREFLEVAAVAESLSDKEDL